MRKNLKEKNIDTHEIQKQLERIGYCPDGGFNVLFDKQEKEVSIKIKIISE